MKWSSGRTNPKVQTVWTSGMQLMKKRGTKKTKLVVFQSKGSQNNISSFNSQCWWDFPLKMYTIHRREPSFAFCFSFSTCLWQINKVTLNDVAHSRFNENSSEFSLALAGQLMSMLESVTRRPGPVSKSLKRQTNNRKQSKKNKKQHNKTMKQSSSAWVSNYSATEVRQWWNTNKVILKDENCLFLKQVCFKIKQQTVYD